jgi:FKBP-type peptidyl-prolyl cis-trans isomerase SlyD
MKVTKDRVVTLEYKISTDTGALIESSVGRGVPVTFIQGRGFMLPGLDSRLDGMDTGEKKDVVLPPEEAFGTIEQQQTSFMMKKEFPADTAFSVGMKFQAKMPGSELKITIEVLEALDEKVKVRLIHPYAGKKIRCELTIVGVRAATARELETGLVEAVAPKTGTAPPPPPPSGDRESIPELDIELEPEPE